MLLEDEGWIGMMTAQRILGLELGELKALMVARARVVLVFDFGRERVSADRGDEVHVEIGEVADETEGGDWVWASGGK